MKMNVNSSSPPLAPTRPRPCPSRPPEAKGKNDPGTPAGPQPVALLLRVQNEQPHSDGFFSFWNTSSDPRFQKELHCRHRRWAQDQTRNLDVTQGDARNQLIAA